MTTVYDNALSPFARKVRLVLDHKGIAYEAVDGLERKRRDALGAVNGRVEVPVLVHGEDVVVNSADIVAYVERVFPQHPVYPTRPGAFARARAWERCSDTVVDAILVDISYWSVVFERQDAMPDGLLDAARTDLARVYAAIERDLSDRDFVCGELSIADLALFPQLTGARMLGVGVDGQKWPALDAWLRRMRTLPICVADIHRAKSYMASMATHDIERDKIFWRGDRIEWLLARGFHRWFLKEIEDARVLWPGLGIPGEAS